MKGELSDILSEYPCMTIKEINATLKKRLPQKHNVSDNCVSKTLDGMHYTMKKVYLHPEKRNSIRIKYERIQYVNWYLTNAIEADLCVFIDEAGSNIWSSRTRGRSIRGQPAVRIVNNQRQESYSYYGSCVRNWNSTRRNLFWWHNY